MKIHYIERYATYCSFTREKIRSFPVMFGTMALGGIALICLSILMIVSALTIERFGTSIFFGLCSVIPMVLGITLVCLCYQEEEFDILEGEILFTRKVNREDPEVSWKERIEGK